MVQVISDRITLHLQHSDRSIDSIYNITLRVYIATPPVNLSVAIVTAWHENVHSSDCNKVKK